MAEPALAADFTETMEVVFQNVQYIVTITTARGDTLTIEVESKRDANRWRGDFTSRYIEDITSKTGNYKKYPVFVRMLMSALKQGSDSVFVDLLTYADLEMLKARKEKAQGANAPRQLPPNNKRYLILTYAAEFDRVHFPLPLLYEENPDPALLKKTVSSLRAEVETLQAAVESNGHVSSGGVSGLDPAMMQELRQLRHENADLQDQLAKARAGMQQGAMGPEVQRLTSLAKDAEKELRLMRKEKEMLAERAEVAEHVVEKERAIHRREMRRKVNTITELETQLQSTKDTAKDARAKARMLTEELDNLKRRGAAAQRRQAYGAPGPSSRGNSRGGSRGVSPGHSRGASPGNSRSTSRAQSPRVPHTTGRAPTGSRTGGGRPTSAGSARSSGSRGPSPARPTSAGRAPRFDPTAYIKQKKEDQRARHIVRSKRSFSPAGSRASSGRSTPTREPSFSDYNRPRASSRGGSVERSGGGRRPSESSGVRAQSGRRTPDNATRDTYQPRSRQVSNGSTAAARRPSSGRAGGGRASLDTSRDNGPRPSSKTTKPTARERPTSPGAALQDVKNRLADHARGPAEPREETPSRTEVYHSLEPAPNQSHADEDKDEPELLPEADSIREYEAPSKAGMFEDATEEIASIDQRLHALQSFLKAAKGAGGSSGGPGKGYR